MAKNQLEELKKKVQEGKKEEKKPGEELAAKPSASVGADLAQVERIVEKMQKKYKSEGIEFESPSGKLGELKGIISESGAAKLTVQTVEELKYFQNPIAKSLGRLYLGLKGPMGIMNKLLGVFSQATELSYYLYSANMPYSAQQWMAITTAGSMVVGVFFFIASFLSLDIIAGSYNYENFQVLVKIVISLMISMVVFFLTAVIAMLIPRSAASKRGEEVSAELPYVLRHMSTELKAGIGLYRALQTVAAADYGVASEELAQTITEIEEGTDAKDALKHLALRTQSKPMRGALIHIVRAMKTGGNLSEIMNEIADDVSFELHNKIRDFSERMNFYGVLYIFIAIVAPVAVGIIGAVVNARLGNSTALSGIPLDPVTIPIFYLIIMPILLFYMVILVLISQPKL